MAVKRLHQVARVALFLTLTVSLTVGVPLQQLSVHGDPWRRVSALSDEAEGGQDAAGGTAGYEAVGVCKATCVQKIFVWNNCLLDHGTNFLIGNTVFVGDVQYLEMLNWPPSDKQCLDNDQCVMCWQLCELLHEAAHKWRSSCSETDCSVGCTLACNFDFSKQTSGWSDSPWEFPSTPVTTEEGDNALTVSWPLPRRLQSPTSGSDGAVSPVFFVYTLLFKVEGNPYWSKATSTVNLEVEVTGDHASLPGLHFLLLATSTHGTVAVSHPPYPGVSAIRPTTTHATTARPRPPLPANPVKPNWDPSMFTDKSSTGSQRKTGSELFPSEKDQSGRMWALSVSVKVSPEGRLQAVVSWRHELLHPLPLFYVITWGRHSCNVNPAVPHCPLEEEEVTAEVAAQEEEEMKLVVSELTYNSQYRLDVGLSGVAPQQVYFYTPVCILPNSDFTLCAEKMEAEKRPNPVVILTTSRGITTTQQASDNNDAQEAFPNLSQVQIVVINAAVSVATLLIAVIGRYIYRKFCQRPDANQEMLKLMQSYASLNASISQSGSMANIMQHRINQQAMLHTSLYSTSPDRAQSLHGHLVDNALNRSMHQLESTPINPPSPHLPLTTLPPLPRNPCLGVSSIPQQSTPTTLPDHAAVHHTAFDTVAPVMGAHALHLAANPLNNSAMSPIIYDMESSNLAALAAIGDRTTRSRSMESLNRVSVGLGLPAVTRKASSNADLILHGWLHPDEAAGRC